MEDLRRLAAGARRVAVIARPRHADLAARVESALVTAGATGGSDEVTVHRVNGRLSDRDLHVALAALAPLDLVVDLLVDGGEERWSSLSPHTASYVHRLRGEGGPEWEAHETDQRLLPLVRDADVLTVLTADPTRGRVIEQRPAARWETRSSVRTSARMPLNPLSEVVEAPALTLREWYDVVALPRQAAISRGLVLPESFSTADDRRLVNPTLEKVTPRFVVPPAALDRASAGEARPLAGAFYHLENVMVRHFGHALTEVVSRLWGWSSARERHPDLRALVFDPTGDLAGWQWDLLAAGGVDRADVEVATGPVRVETLVGATPQFSRPAFAHPGLLEVMDRVGGALADSADPGERPARIFLTRRPVKRVCRNAAEVHARFEAAGYTVLLPEQRSLAEQMALVRAADHVAGFAGSGMFHIGYTDRPTHVVLITSENYPAVNETLMAGLRGHDLDIAVCRPDVERPVDRFVLEAFHSDFELRAPQWRFLEEVLTR